MDHRKRVKALAKKYLDEHKPLDWFEELYAQVQSENYEIIPWADLEPNPNMTEIVEANSAWKTKSGRALVIGCGLGDDAAYLQGLGFQVDAFDISSSAIEICKKRFSKSDINFFPADLFKYNADSTYDFIFEAYTLQVFPRELRLQAIESLPSFLASSGTLLIVCRGRDESDPIGDMPFPLASSDFHFLRSELKEVSFEDYMDQETPAKRRFRAVYQKG